MGKRSFRDDYYTHKYRIPTFFPSETPDYNTYGKSKNILRKHHYLLILFLKFFPRQSFLVSVGEL